MDRDAQEESETNLVEGPRVVVVQPPSPQRRGPEGRDTGKDTSQLIYASVSDEHKQKKRYNIQCFDISNLCEHYYVVLLM